MTLDSVTDGCTLTNRYLESSVLVTTEAKRLSSNSPCSRRRAADAPRA